MDKQYLSRSSCHAAGRVIARLLLSFLAVSTTTPVAASSQGSWTNQAPLFPFLPPPRPLDGDAPIVPGGQHSLTLRHVFHHGAYLYPELHRRIDVSPAAAMWSINDDDDDIENVGILQVRSTATEIQRMVDRSIKGMEPLLSAARLSGQPVTLSHSAWSIEQVPSPNITDKQTVISLANVAANAYVRVPGQEDWSDVGSAFNESQPFGWEGDGLRGHIYADENNSTIVIGLKGTSIAVFDGAETTTNDKENDNLFSGCCCGQGGQYLWRQVCDCMTSAFTCNETCVTKALRKENRYYRAAIELYGNVTELYPESNIWIAGHSLGGAVSGLLGLTFGLPTVTFEAYGEALAASRLGIPSPPNAHAGAPQSRKDTGIYHFGHTADPVFMGSCNSATSACTLGGYAFETQCHTGHICVYDVVEDKGWRVGIGTHRIRHVIKDVIEAYDAVAECVPDDECIDCFNWKHIHSNGSEPTTTATKTSTTTTTAQTRTSTCKTPGWWGCLDESTTSQTITSTSATTTNTTTSATSTCKTMGWFGCLDKTTTIPTTSTKQSATPAPMLTTTSLSLTTSASSSSTLMTSCATPGLIWGCKDKSTTSPAHAITAPPEL